MDRIFIPVPNLHIHFYQCMSACKKYSFYLRDHCACYALHAYQTKKNIATRCVLSSEKVLKLLGLGSAPEPFGVSVFDLDAIGVSVSASSGPCLEKIQKYY